LIAVEIFFTFGGSTWTGIRPARDKAWGVNFPSTANLMLPFSTNESRIGVRLGHTGVLGIDQQAVLASLQIQDEPRDRRVRSPFEGAAETSMS
jgi:hypothetical protein